MYFFRVTWAGWSSQSHSFIDENKIHLWRSHFWEHTKIDFWKWDLIFFFLAGVGECCVWFINFKIIISFTLEDHLFESCVCFRRTSVTSQPADVSRLLSSASPQPWPIPQVITEHQRWAPCIIQASTAIYSTGSSEHVYYSICGPNCFQIRDCKFIL